MACNCPDVLQPWMYVEDPIATQRLDRFNNNQGLIFTRAGIFGPAGSRLFYSKADFMALWDYVKTPGNFNVNSVDGLRVYFALYGAEGSTSVPPGYGGKFT